MAADRPDGAESSPRIDLPDPPKLWLTHYPRLLAAYRRRGEDGLEAIEEALRAKAAAQPTGKFSKRQAAYVPFVPLPPVDWRHKCGHCRFWVDHGPGKAGECMIVGRDDDYLGGAAIHEEAGCALFMPPAGEQPFEWISEQLHPTGADLVRGEYHAPGQDDEHGERSGKGRAGERGSAGKERARRHTMGRDVGDTYVPAGTRISLEPVVTGLTAPVAMEADPAEPSRRFVADQSGRVYVHESDERDGDGPHDGLREEPLLDLSEQMVELRTQYDERGLLGMALHREFAENGRLFVRYSAPRRDETPEAYDHTEVLAEFRVDDDRTPVDPASERALLEIPSPEFNHNAGAVAFGPDDHLYVAMGDGGGEGDTGPGHVDGGNGQDVTENLLGGILRIDVDSESEGRAYGIPEDNPLVGDEGLDEYYAWGLRNPWRMSFDSEGRLFAADVGQHLYEEVDVVEKGGNYGWNVREGTHCFDPESPTDPPANCPDESVRGEPLLDPIVEYPHVRGGQVIGSAVVGGHVYEGSAVSELDGAYVFGDWATTQDRPSGRLFAARPDGDEEAGGWEMEELVVADTENGRPNRHVLAFCRDDDGEIYVCTSDTHVPSGETGAVHRIVSGN